MLIAIDPGKKGAIAWRDDNSVGVEDMPESLRDIWEFLRDLCVGSEAKDVMAILENVGFHRPGNSAVASATFAEHVGSIKMALTGLKVPWRLVSPQVWMKAVGSLPKDKKERKQAIRERMQARYPGITITADNADALGILTWALDRKAEGRDSHFVERVLSVESKHVIR